MTLFLLLTIFACGDTKTTDTSSTSIPFLPTMPQSECGLPEYSFLPTDEMGQLLSSEFREDLSLSKEAIQAVLANYDLQLPPPTNGIETYYIEYSTQSKGQPSQGTGMIILPEGKPSAPVLLWLHPTMGFNDDCAPTAIGVFGAAYPAIFASLGFIVVAPDYDGMRGWTGESDTLHPYISAEATAIFSIDSLRALPNLLHNYNKSIEWDAAKIVLWGASEGGFASLITDRYLPHYAPEFETIATLASTPVTDVFALANRAISEYTPTSAGMVGVNVTLRQWYESEIPLESMLLPEFAATIEDGLFNSCSDFGSIEEVTTIDQLFQQTFIEGVLYDDERVADWKCFATDNDLKTKVPWIRTAPTLIVTAENDDLAWPSPVHDDIPLLCAQGYVIEHRQCAGAGHVSGSLDSLGEQFAWLNARLNGDDLGQTCVVANPEPCGVE